MSELIIVTGASSNHFGPLKNLLHTISVFEPNTRTFVYDLGLDQNQTEELRLSGHAPIRFRFEIYPPHVNIAIDSGQYAWKPIIVAEVVENTRGAWVLWLDAGDLIKAKLWKIRKVIAWRGFYSPVSAGSISRWTHPGTLRYLNVPNDLLRKRNRNGAVVGFDAWRSGIRELVEEWKRCALDPDCIAPVGSNRSNHRQDQAVLSVLAYKVLYNYGHPFENELLDVSTHNDSLSFMQVRQNCDAISGPSR